MKAEKISLVNYRSIDRAQIEFSDGVNLIYGDNAKGKTNVLEAVYSFARGKSFRANSERELVRFGADGYYTELTFSDNTRVQSMSLGYADKKRQKKINSMPCEKLYDMIGRFCAVLFCPEHLGIVKGGPGERREFLNIAISQLDRAYIKTLSRYKLIVESRNALLRKIQMTEDKKKRESLIAQLDIYSTQMAESAAYICRVRDEYIRGMSPFAEFFLGEMSDNKEKLSLEYECDIDENIRGDEKKTAGQYLEKLRTNTEREISSGATLYGIHRDDIKIVINKLDARNYASQGQQRSIALALKMAEGEMSHKKTGEHPVFLFDDVLSELDTKRRSYLLSKIRDRQLIITSCETADIDRIEGARLIHALGDGVYEQLGGR